MFEWLFKAKQIKATKQIQLLFEPTHVLWDITGNLVLLAAVTWFLVFLAVIPCLALFSEAATTLKWKKPQLVCGKSDTHYIKENISTCKVSLIFYTVWIVHH